jgi:glyoxylase-like metal-dependent hydrolase (beta-lactamase superfamily II)
VAEITLYKLNTGYLTIRAADRLSAAGLAQYRMRPDDPVRIPVIIYAVRFGDTVVYFDSGLDTRRYPMGHVRESLYRPERVPRLARLFPRASRHIVCMTHLHSDHTGNLDILRPETVYIHDTELRDAMRPMSARRAYIKRHLAHRNIAVFRPEDFLDGYYPFPHAELPGCPDITVLSTPGHTYGGLSFLVHYGGFRLLFAGDLVEGLAGMLYPPYHTADNPSAYIEQIVLTRAWMQADPNLLVFLSHESPQDEMIPDGEIAPEYLLHLQQIQPAMPGNHSLQAHPR